LVKGKKKEEGRNFPPLEGGLEIGEILNRLSLDDLPDVQHVH